MEDNKYDFDYNDFDPEKKYEIKNNKSSMSHDRVIGYDNASEKMRSHFESEEGKEHLQKWHDSLINGGEEWRKKNPDLIKENAKRGGLVQGPIQGKLNVESGHWSKVQETGQKAFKESEYIGSKDFYDRSSRGGITTSQQHIDNGIIGKDSVMSKYRMAKNRKKWANCLIKISKDEFLPKDATEHMSQKQWLNIKTKSDLVIKLDKMGGYHNTSHYYKLNMKSINQALLASDNFDDYRE